MSPYDMHRPGRRRGGGQLLFCPECRGTPNLYKMTETPRCKAGAHSKPLAMVPVEYFVCPQCGGTPQPYPQGDVPVCKAEAHRPIEMARRDPPR
jgi:hypothetical protein